MTDGGISNSGAVGEGNLESCRFDRLGVVPFDTAGDTVGVHVLLVDGDTVIDEAAACSMNLANIASSLSSRLSILLLTYMYVNKI